MVADMACRVLTIAICRHPGGHYRRLVPRRSRGGGRRCFRGTAHAPAPPTPCGGGSSAAALRRGVPGVLSLPRLRAGDGFAAADGDPELARHRRHVPGLIRLQSPAGHVRLAGWRGRHGGRHGRPVSGSVDPSARAYMAPAGSVAQHRGSRRLHRRHRGRGPDEQHVPRGSWRPPGCKHPWGHCR